MSRGSSWGYTNFSEAPGLDSQMETPNMLPPPRALFTKKSNQIQHLTCLYPSAQCQTDSRAANGSYPCKSVILMSFNPCHFSSRWPEYCLSQWSQGDTCTTRNDASLVSPLPIIFRFPDLAVASLSNSLRIFLPQICLVSFWLHTNF